jgi:hypothetical protein
VNISFEMAKKNRNAYKEDLDDEDDDVEKVETHNHNNRNVEVEGGLSIMRSTTSPHLDDKGLAKNERIVRRRGVFKWLPVDCDNDMQLGSWYFVWGCLLCILIPAMPLISLYLTPSERFWPTADAFIFPLDKHTAVYALLCGCGFLNTVASLFLVRAFSEPIPEPYNSSIIPNDEVLASWLFFLGILPTIPLVVIYVMEFPDNLEYRAALIFCVFISVVMLFFVYLVYPSADKVPFELISPHLHRCCGPTRGIFRHVENDWLIFCWVVVMGSVFATVGSIMVMIYYASFGNRFGIFNFATGAFDCLLFLIGAMYYVAGSYTVTALDRNDDIETPQKYGGTVSTLSLSPAEQRKLSKNGSPVENPMDKKKKKKIVEVVEEYDEPEPEPENDEENNYKKPDKKKKKKKDKDRHDSGEMNLQ